MLGLLQRHLGRVPAVRQARDAAVRARGRLVAGTHGFASFGRSSTVRPPIIVHGREGIDVGQGVFIDRGAFLAVVPGGRLRIGDRTSAGRDLVIACAGSVSIGPDTTMSDRVFIGDTYHEYHDATRPISQQGMSDPRPVTIGAGSFLGINACVLPGVTIGEGAVVGAGSVVTADVPPRTVVAGNPARPIRRHDGERWVDAGHGA